MAIAISLSRGFPLLGDFRKECFRGGGGQQAIGWVLDLECGVLCFCLHRYANDVHFDCKSSNIISSAQKPLIGMAAK